MKRIFPGMMMTLALVLAIVMGVVALAESAEPQVPELPAIEDAQPAPETETPDAGSDDTALQEALEAYNAARQSSKLEDLESELNGYVASGKLTQEQADLILNYYKERESLRNGVCPGCGYQFQTDGFGRGGRDNKGGKGMNGMNGMNGKGGKGGRGGMRGFGGQADAGTPNSESFQSILPEADTQADEGI